MSRFLLVRFNHLVDLIVYYQCTPIKHILPICDECSRTRNHRLFTNMEARVLVALCLLCVFTSISATKYEANWDSIDSRPLPSWFDEAKVGIFLHWGVFSVPATAESPWFWYWWKTNTPLFVKFMKDFYPPNFTYADFAPQFHAAFYNPDQWADIFEAAGARYIVLVTKHHEGFTLWPSKHSWNWNAGDVGPKRDLLGDLAVAVRKKKNMRFGVYHSLFEFYNPEFLQDQANHFKTQDFVWSKTMPELFELVNNYHPEVIWSDGHWMAQDVYWNSTNFLAWLYNESPVKDSVVVNDRWGIGTDCHHGGYWNCKDRYNPGRLLPHKWENAMTLDKKCWGIRREIMSGDIYSLLEIVTELAQTVSCGGNLLMNVPPTADGLILPLFEERLRQFGAWMKTNGEAIYASKPWHTQNDTITKDVWYTTQRTVNATDVYAIVLSWPKNNILQLSAPIPMATTEIQMLGYDGGNFKFTTDVNNTLNIVFPDIPFLHLPSTDAWVLKMINLKNQFVSPDFERVVTPQDLVPINLGNPPRN